MSSLVSKDATSVAEPFVPRTDREVFMKQIPGYKPYKGIVDATIRICREEGVKTMYTGLIPSLLLTSHAAIQFVIYEKLKVIETNYRNRIVIVCGISNR